MSNLTSLMASTASPYTWYFPIESLECGKYIHSSKRQVAEQLEHEDVLLFTPLAMASSLVTRLWRFSAASALTLQPGLAASTTFAPDFWSVSTRKPPPPANRADWGFGGPMGDGEFSVLLTQQSANNSLLSVRSPLGKYSHPQFTHVFSTDSTGLTCSLSLTERHYKEALFLLPP
jgi:hypothetical protein